MDSEYLVVGAGVVGLALAGELATLGETLLLEREDAPGRGISSRNSEVLHAGIYYEPGSWKARFCVEGRRRIEDWARQGHFACRRTGKFIVATSEEELAALGELLRRGVANGVEDLRWASPGELAEAEPAVRAHAALYSPSTAVLDSHGLMRFLRGRAERRGAQLALRTRVVDLRRVDGGWAVETEESGPGPDDWIPRDLEERPPRRGARCTIHARRVVLCAGLHTDQLACWAGLPVERDGLRQFWSRGEYFAPAPGGCPPLRHLVYPVPPAGGEGHLGIHATVDLEGAVRFGPSAAWPDPPERRAEEYGQDGSLAAEFARGVRRFLPDLDPGSLTPAGVGLRPRLRPARDFQILWREGLVVLLGIESPGLTSAPALAAWVAGMLTRGRDGLQDGSGS